MARRHTLDVGGEGVNLALMITPMLDMAFQLMAFFIMTYHPSATERHLSGALLPPANVAKAGKADPRKDDKEPPPANVDPDVKEVLRVIVKAVAKGQLEGELREGDPSRILLQMPESPDPELIA